MHLDIQHHSQFLHVQFSRPCNLNYSNTDEFKTQVLGGYEFGQTVILNFEKLDFIDSAGLTALICIRKKIIETQGSLKIVNVGERIQKLIQITRVHRVFEFYDSLESAIKSLEKKADKSNKSHPYNIHLQVEHTESYSLIRIEQPDSLIAANCQQFKDEIQKCFQKSGVIILNFDAICNVDSDGIAALIHLKRYARERSKKIFLVYNNRVLNRLFKLYSLDDLFPQFQTDEEAISAVEPVVPKQKIVVKPIPTIPELETATSGSELEFSDILFLSSWQQ